MINITEVLFSAASSLISLSICACIVTSRAVVGSSAIRSLGLQESAIAIITLWSIPPLISNGYCSYRCSAGNIPTFSNKVSTYSFASDFFIFNFLRTSSAICSPAFIIGSRDVIGS